MNAAKIIEEQAPPPEVIKPKPAYKNPLHAMLF